MTDKTLYCSFCGKNQHEVAKLIAGPKAYICDECVMLCVAIVEDKQGFEKSRVIGEAQHKTLMEMMDPPKFDKGYLDHLKGLVDGFTGKVS